MSSFNSCFRYGRTVLFLLLFGYSCFYLGTLSVRSGGTNVTIVREDNEPGHPAKSVTDFWAQFFVSESPKFKAVLEVKEPVKGPVLPETESEERHPTNVPCPNNEEFVKENDKRLNWIQQECPNTVRTKLSEIKEMFYFPKSDLGWCPVYKAASSNVFAHFCNDYFDEETCQNKHIKMKDYEGGFRSVDDFREKDPPPESEQRFLVVRDPFARLLSAYRNKVELLSHTTAYTEFFMDTLMHYRPIRWITNFDKRERAFKAINYAQSMTEGRNQRKPEPDNPYLYPPYPTFKEIVYAVIAGRRDNHVIPASQRCGPCGSTHYDYLLKAETFDCDIKNMFELTGNSRLLTNTERWATNQTPVLNQTMFYSYYSTLTSDQLDDLLNLYQDDCLLFQYPCQKHVDNIRKFKSLNPDFKHEYRNTWSGRVGDWDTIS